ncbi:hypothetical protein BCR41DRAFT_88971 [Lobosporangium transversale]|uniref:Uncharacterized protein n=1 Tax=Lobosporangium transversale TaxID=64571 RepID=A0A1Y2GKH4_9FUNG|nr:hypothetical protein BCR41DRAFT_88971 [Lobosporangium transversale]ORZ13795.1 hypothetical protein BCR41DRAFT_88971 [Lobosporangium transversale]|eukprot:XP_021880579.1 hypothetical protein BCR41DRAFT_88971 [Lobosporangium transversale]
METEMLGGFAEKQAQLTEQAKIEVEQAKAKQKLAEESLARQTQKLRAIEMLNTQLEAKGINFDKIKGEMTELQKKLTSAQKELEQVSRRSKQESSELRAKLMKAEADMGNRHEWLSQQKERWEREEESKRGNQTKELQQRINELEQQLEDSGTERYLEIEMAKEERKNSEDKLRNANEKLDDANSKIKSLQHTIMELRLKNSTLERKIDTLEHEVNTQTLNNTEVEEFEEIVPDSISARTPVAKKVDRPTIHPTMQSMSLSNLSRDRLDHALSVIDDLKSQLTLVRLFSDGQNHKQGLVALTEQVKILTKEKQALQDELTRRLLDFNNQRSSGSSIQSASVLSHQMTKHPSRLDEAKTPTSADTIARTNSALPKKTARKRKQTENITNYDTHPAADSSLSPMDQNFNMDDIDTITGGGSPSSSLIDSNIKKRSRSSEPSVVPTSGTKPKKARAGRKATKTTSTDLSHIQIRNISVNPVTPSIAVPRHYFSLLMNSAIVDDSQPYTKLEAIARILPEKLSDFFETVQSKAKDIIATVSGYRRELDIMQDSTRSWELDGFEPIVITESLHLSEVYIVQLVCLLQARFSEVSLSKYVIKLQRLY